jgi:uncharacterized membrane protein YjjP (DUF1212 family)
MGNQSKKMTFWNKVTLAIWIIIGFALLSFFTFTVFIIAFVIGIIIFILRIFLKTRPPFKNPQQTKTNPFTNQSNRSNNPKDNDIIDI